MQVIIENEEYLTLKQQAQCFKVGDLWIKKNEWFTGGYGGVFQHGIEVYSKEKNEIQIIIDFKKERADLNEKINKLNYQCYNLNNELQELKSKNWIQRLFNL